MGKLSVMKQAFQGVALAFLVVGVFFAGGFFLNGDISVALRVPKETSIDGITLPNGVVLSKPKLVEGSVEGLGGRKNNHPMVTKEEILDRKVKIPKDVAGKWKAVKLLIKDKGDREANEFKIVELGSSFDLAKRISVTVGPFLPNFLMNENYYTSMNNQLLNPAVRLLIKENEKLIYDGWAFARYPELYGFEHSRYGIQLTDYIPEVVS